MRDACASAARGNRQFGARPKSIVFSVRPGQAKTRLHSEALDRLALQGSIGQSVDQARLGTVSDFGMAPEIRDLFAHREPPADDLSLGVLGRVEDLERCRIIDGGLDSEDTEMIVAFDGLASEAELDRASLRALLAVDHHFAAGILHHFSHGKTSIAESMRHLKRNSRLLFDRRRMSKNSIGHVSA